MDCTEVFIKLVKKVTSNKQQVFQHRVEVLKSRVEVLQHRVEVLKSRVEVLDDEFSCLNPIYGEGDRSFDETAIASFTLEKRSLSLQ